MIFHFIFFNFSERLPDEGGISVNFNIHMDPAKGATSARELTEILQQEVLASNVTGKHIKCSISQTAQRSINQKMVQF